MLVELNKRHKVSPRLHLCMQRLQSVLQTQGDTNANRDLKKQPQQRRLPLCYKYIP